MFTSTGNKQIDLLNAHALEIAKRHDNGFGVLSTGEQCYVALAANRADLLTGMGYTIPQAMARIGEEWCSHLIYSWQYAGNPANY